MQEASPSSASAHRPARAGRLPRLLPGVTRALGLAVLLPGALLGQPAAPPPPTLAELGRIPAGRTVTAVAAASDRRSTYALYVPSGYDAARPWPVLFLMDPRGRAELPLELFRPAAERLGFLLLSSHDTMSDGPSDPNERALEAMLADVQRFFHIDGRRLYLAGFSGTARAAWLFAVGLGEHVAGVIGFGAGLPSDYQGTLEAMEGFLGFAFFGGAGTTDFNLEEVLRLDRRLDGLGVPHRVVRWAGPHGWPPEEVCRRALEWMRLQAMRSGLESRDAGWIADLLGRRRAEAVALEEAGRTREAAALRRAIAEDFAEVAEVAADRERASRLESSPELRRLDRVEEELLERRRERDARLAAVVGHLAGSSPPPADRAAAMLRLPALMEEAADSTVGTGSEEAAFRRDAARRFLEAIFVQASFYLPRHHLGRGEPARALAVLDLADRIHPRHPAVCLMRARGLAGLGRTREAVEALACAAESGRLDPESLAADPDLAPLREDPALRTLLERLREP